ncbi:hypothetical protein AKJ35_00400 [candidate division MSBL1 archaeon SCGC-AAA833F18]|uniref:GtrA/DPMS transmembrane domain-containing protein n=3 Tax=candidate division MSBL1 TaxID=215777 RepID=A0A133VT40_9EURY|nr:hypothetical protein AKJ47_01670 [candidate division MSBL1 archaeon SCGC-AAA261G05]KXB04756.1 hypothetical protein AKJ48_01490 [candidate division MSBL1 archaeon SCGC-AAA261O19]KXB09606.1 hypothetical protein AKJ35_00400 [candidate division MSBL1 archaeon SCGC-AAA833F18]
MKSLREFYKLVDEKLETKRFLKFCMVGLSGVGVNLGLLWILTDHFGIYYLVSAVFSVETSILTNFTLNELWTFSDRVTNRSTRPLLGRLTKFNLISAGGLVINITILWAFTEFLGFYYLISALFGIAGATLWNYFANASVTWKKSAS